VASKHEKRPAFGAIPTGLKQPKVAEEPQSFNHLKASWRVRNVQMIQPYGWHELTVAEILYVKDKLGSFESMTWNEIFVIAKKQNHDISVADLRCDVARRWMARNMPDQPTLWTIRFSGAERVWGIFSGGAYQVVFWDPKHLIYPTNR
jgi:hypothetical protein